MESLYKKFFEREKTRRITFFIIFLLIILAVYFVGRFLILNPKNIPAEFLKANEEASMAANDIVDISKTVSLEIKEINKLDDEKKYDEALNLIIQELNRTFLMRQKALVLASNLETMTKNISSITPDSLARKVLEAITSETALISRLTTYNEYLTRLLEIMRDKLLGRYSADGVSALVNKINEEAAAINELNEKYLNTIKSLDL